MGDLSGTSGTLEIETTQAEIDEANQVIVLKAETGSKVLKRNREGI